MTDILCKWLNEEVCLEPKLSKSSLSDVFSNGYLFGEILHKHGLQLDFAHFSNGTSSEAKLNNFTRLEPTFKLLEIPFNINIARDVMVERPGVATRLLYQLFVALNRVKEGRVTGQSLESMKPSGRVKLERIETGIFQKRLKQQTPRQVDLNFEGLIQKFQERQKSFEEKLSSERKREEEMFQQERREVCHKSLEKSREVRERRAQLYTKLKPLSTPKTPLTPPTVTGSKTTGSLAETSRSRRVQAEAIATREGIDSFETTLSLRCAPTDGETRPLSGGSIMEQGTQSKIPEQVKSPSSDYVNQIRKKVQDNELARKEREKRRRKVLVEQMQALQEQENARRERVLVERLMRQCQQERRIATQLMAIRKEKETVRNNRIFRLKQYEEQRIKEFNEALDRERELARCEAVERAEKLKHHQLVYKQLRAHQAKLSYKKDYAMCQEVLLLVVDLASKLAEYKRLTRGLVPAKLMIDWKTLFISGKSAYDDPPVSNPEPPADLMGQSIASSASSALRKSNTELLDKADLEEYKNATNEWAPPDDFTDKLPRPPNSIVGHIVYRLIDLVDPPKPPPSPPKFPKFTLRASFVGRPFAGKSSVTRRLEQDVPSLNVLNPESLVTKAVATYLSERRLLESQLSTGSMEGEQSPPVISVEPSTPLLNPAPPTIPQVEVTNDEASGPLGSTSSLNDQLVMQLSPLGQLGHKAHTTVISGECVDDETVVEIIAHEMRTFPDESGFILDNFPVTLNQVHVLGRVVFGPVQNTPQAFQLLPNATDLSGEQKSVSDLIMLFKVSTDNVLLRASQAASDQPLASNKLEQIHHRLMTFDSEWPQLRRWIRQFTSIVTVNADVSEDTLYEIVKDKVQESINQAKHTNVLKKLGLSRRSSGFSTGSTSELISSPPKEVKYSRGRRRPSSASMLEATAAAFTQAKASGALTFGVSAEPGEPDWQYCNLPLDMELATGLAQIWPSLETAYLGTLREVFQQLRAERETICHYFFDKRNEFMMYLKRPDTKQEFVSQWQNSYNSLSIHLRREELMKAELHQRVDDLCEKLWDISDHRREGAGQERERILSDNWVEDHIGLLTNHYISLMQAELDRFYSTFLLLKDYYTGMENKVPSKLPEPGRIPLIQLEQTEPQNPPPSNVSSTHSIQEAPKKEGDEASNASIVSPKRVPSNRRKSKVPLLPRQLLPEPVEDKAPKKKGGGAVVLTPPPPAEDTSGLELDQQLVVHAYNTATAFVFTNMVREMRALESVIAELSKHPSSSQPAEPPLPDVKEEKSGKGKKDKAKSPAGKKGKASPVKGAKGAPPPPDPVPETPAHALNPDELAKREKAVLMNKEFQTALQQEETRVKLRLELIKLKSLRLIEAIKESARELGEEMEQWLEETYKQEVECVNSLAEVLRQAIENEEKLLKEIVLPGISLSIKESCLLSYPTPPPSPPPPTEPSHPHIFTVSQLLSLHSQLHPLAPNGYVLCSSLVEILLNLTERSSDGTSLPDLWTSLSREQLEALCESVYGMGSDMVDWRRLLVVLAQPWTIPTFQQLVDALVQYQTASVSGRVSREQYQTIRTWLDESGEERDARLKSAFFEMFSDASTDDLDFTSMLLYLCSDPTPGEGLLKALCVVTGRDVGSDEQTTVSMEELNKALTHTAFPDSPPLSTSDLFDLFLMLSPAHPNEVVVCDLVHKESAWEYLITISPYVLTSVESLLRSPSAHTEAD